MSIKKGSMVRLTTGETPILVTAKYRRGGLTRVDGVYAYGMHQFFGRVIDDFLLWDGQWSDVHPDDFGESAGSDLIRNPNEKEEIMLFQTNEKEPRYGVKLATNSEGQVVLEMRGESGKVEAFAADKISEVVPYTYKVQNVHSGSNQVFVGSVGLVSNGDILLDEDGAMYRVLDIDTKDRQAKRVFKGSKVMTQPLAKVKQVG